MVFVESYGRVAVEDPELSPGVNAGPRRRHPAARARRLREPQRLPDLTDVRCHQLARARDAPVRAVGRQPAAVRPPRDQPATTLTSLFGRAGWRTVAAVPANNRDWPQGAFYDFDHVYDSRNVGYEGPRFGYPTMPDQYTLDAFHRLELAPRDRRPVMAEIDLISSHAPWSRTPRMMPQATVGDGSVFDGMPSSCRRRPTSGPTPKRVRAAYGDADRVLTAGGPRVHDDVRRRRPRRGAARRPPAGDHRLRASDAGHDVPVSIIARDPAVLDRIAALGLGRRPAAATATRRSGGWTRSATGSSRRTAPRATLGPAGGHALNPGRLRASPEEEECEMPKDEVALMQQLHDEHAAVLWRFCLRLVANDRGRAEDVVQETLLRAWRNRTILDSPPPAVRSWLFTVARNIVIDEWRSRRARQRDPGRRGAGARRREDDESDQLLLSWVVAEALTQLSEDHRAVLLECYYRGRPVAEAARRLGVPRDREVAHALRAACAEAGAGGDGGERMSCSSSPTTTGPTSSVRSPRPSGWSSRGTCPTVTSAPGRSASSPGCPVCSAGSTRGCSRTRRSDEPVPATLLPALSREVGSAQPTADHGNGRRWPPLSSRCWPSVLRSS